jgi:hypothetical protein
VMIILFGFGTSARKVVFISSLHIRVSFPLSNFRFFSLLLFSFVSQFVHSFLLTFQIIFVCSQSLEISLCPVHMTIRAKFGPVKIGLYSKS